MEMNLRVSRLVAYLLHRFDLIDYRWLMLRNAGKIALQYVACWLLLSELTLGEIVPYTTPYYITAERKEKNAIPTMFASNSGTRS